MENESQRMPGERVFLSAEWRHLVMLNYEVDPGLLAKYVPPGTELDAFAGRVYVSLVGFRFLHTKLFGILPIPFHGEFEEVNLRFYVRRRDPQGDRRGVVFIREIVPKRAMAHVARLAYGENYVRYPMRHAVRTNGAGITTEYQWQLGRTWCRLFAEGLGSPSYAAGGSLEQFITEHYWGYSARRNGGSLEYHVSHVPWRVWARTTAGFGGDSRSLYGSDLAAILRRSPDSAFIADGSPVLVFVGRPVS
ncbi:MAG: DUF2071 domain-containing protein [Candidatus Acidiferrales bacterium]|jgi:uncharacterized protein YqjF (DUF2071 family)